MSRNGIGSSGANGVGTYVRADQLPKDEPAQGNPIADYAVTGAGAIQLGQQVNDAVEQIRSIADPLDRANLAADLITELQLQIAELCGIRQAAIEAAHLAGMTITEIGSRLRR
ncbi:hypothetical protein ACFXO7_03465 [Nocardia tengchongensis]